MSNVTIHSPLVDGSLMPFVDESMTSKEVVEFLTGDDLRPPPRSVQIIVKTQAGKVVTLIIPNDNTATIVKIDGDFI